MQKALLEVDVVLATRQRCFLFRGIYLLCPCRPLMLRPFWCDDKPYEVLENVASIDKLSDAWLS